MNERLEQHLAKNIELLHAYMEVVRRTGSVQKFQWEIAEMETPEMQRRLLHEVEKSGFACKSSKEFFSIWLPVSLTPHKF
jgi:hypothetical protein